jgi:hypothetical protein
MAPFWHGFDEHGFITNLIEIKIYLKGFECFSKAMSLRIKSGVFKKKAYT